MSLDMSSTTSIEDGGDSGSETSIFKPQEQHHDRRKATRRHRQRGGKGEELRGVAEERVAPNEA